MQNLLISSININRLRSEEMLSNDSRVEHLTPPGFEPLTYAHHNHMLSALCYFPIILLSCNRLYISNKLYFGVRAIDITQKSKNESVKKSLKKSKYVLEEKRNKVKRKNCIKKTNTFTIIAMSFVQE